MLELNLAKAMELVDAAVAERGADYVYERQGGNCFYVHGDSFVDDETGDLILKGRTPGCIVGLVLVKLGVPLEELGTQERNDMSAGAVLESLGAAGILGYTEEAAEYLGYTQGSQDAGTRWGIAASQAKYFAGIE